MQLIFWKTSFNLLLSKISKFLLYALDLGDEFGGTKSSRTTIWIKWSFTLELKLNRYNLFSNQEVND